MRLMRTEKQIVSAQRDTLELPVVMMCVRQIRARIEVCVRLMRTEEQIVPAQLDSLERSVVSKINLDR